MRPPAKLYLLLAVPLVGALIASVLLTIFGRTTPTAHESNALADIKNVVIACRAYAADHEGLYPPELAALNPVYIDDTEDLFADDSRGSKLPMIYYPGFNSGSAPDSIIIEYPIRYRKNRLVGTVGGQVLAIPVD